MRLTAVIFSLFILFSAQAQEEENPVTWNELGDEWKQWEIKGLSKMPPKTDHLILACSYEAQLYKVVRAYRGKFDVIQSDSLTDFWYNDAKAYWDLNVSNDTLYIPSQVPFKATVVTEIFFWDGDKMHHLEPTFEDDNWTKVERADSLLNAGQISEAIAIIESVEYPHSYYNSIEFAERLMITAHKIAIGQFKVKNYDSACAIMDDALTYYENDIVSLYKTREDLLKDREERPYDQFWSDERIALWMGDYGLFLYKASRLEESVKLNSWLAGMLPEKAGPCLQWADSLYDLNKKEESKKIYRLYISRMEKEGKAKNIPKRVQSRI